MAHRLTLPKPNPPELKVRYKPTVSVVKCPSCKRTKFALFDKVISQGANLDYKICRWCGLVFLGSRFSDDDLELFYREDYLGAKCGNGSPSDFSIEEQRLRGDYQKNIVQSHFEKIETHLDIGCSTGEFLFAIRSAYPDVKSVGIEPSNAYRERCTQNGLEVVPTVDELKSTHSKCFGFISMSHVLEHIPDPVGFLSMLKTDLLTPNGFILLEAPNLLGHSSYEISHLFCFYEKTIRDVLRLSGFKVVLLKKHGIPRALEHVPRNLTILAVPSSQPIRRSSVHPIHWWPILKLLRFKGLTRYGWPRFILKGIVNGPQQIIQWIKTTVG
jgi:SAM-dependent methyltransferase